MEQQYKKDFIIEMQHKGKLPRYETEASKRHDAIYHKTTKRIFPPGADGVGPFVESMLESAAKNIAAAAPHVGPTDRTQAYTLPASEAGTTATSCAVRAEKHQFLKERMTMIETAISEERNARLQTEAELQLLRTRILTSK